MRVLVFGKEADLPERVIRLIEEAIRNEDYERIKSLLRDALGRDVPEEVERAKSFIIMYTKEAVIITETPVFG